ncbi:MAG: lysophospholipase [Phycisphaerae bacterium]|nr:lysophospholipase [Phycisphaerae bacterium]
MFLKLAIVTGILYVAWLTAGCALQRKLIYPRGMVQVPGSSPQWPGLQGLALDTPEGTVEAWFVPGNGISAKTPGPAVIFAHGNAELIDHQVDLVRGYRRLGISVLLCEYRGYGRSAGAPSQKKIVSDFVAAHRRLVSRPEVDPKRIIFHGRSLGAGVVCALAEKHPPAAMILRSPFTSVADIARSYLVPRFAVLDPYDNTAVLRRLDRPVLIMHGRRDRILPIAHGRHLHQIAANSTFVEFDCGHNDFPVESPEHWARVSTFLKATGILEK